MTELRRLRKLAQTLRTPWAHGRQAAPLPHTPETSRMRAGSRIDDLAEWLTETANETLKPLLGHEPMFDTEGAVAQYLDAYPRRPVSDNQGGSGFHSLFWIHMVAAALEPRTIVESGVWKGQSTWALREASPHSDIFSFDIDLSGLVHRDPRVTYTEADWTTVDIPGGQRDLAFFDCHVNHGQRIREAHRRGFRWILLDDDAPAGRLYGFGLPPVPTVSMLLDERVRDGDHFAWTCRGQDFSYTFREVDTRGARGVIEDAWSLPDVATTTMYGGFSFMTLVRLRD